MGFGQYATAEIRNRDKGYPKGTTDLKVGRMTKDEILADANLGGLVSSVKSAHNELTLTYESGTVVCRLRETNIVTLSPGGYILINTGGWNTPTTRSHVMNFLASQNFQINMWGDKKAGGNRIKFTTGENIKVGDIFRQWVIIYPDGGTLSDLDGSL